MQTTDKVTRPFLFKLMLLFALLVSGALLKTPSFDRTAEKKVNTPAPVQPQNENEETEQYTLSPATPVISAVSM